MKRTCVLDQHGQRCMTVDDEKAAELIHTGLAVPYMNRRLLKRGITEPKKGVIQLKVALYELAALDHSQPVGLDRNWMTKQRTVRRELVRRQDGSAAVVWSHRKPNP